MGAVQAHMHDQCVQLSVALGEGVVTILIGEVEGFDVVHHSIDGVLWADHVTCSKPVRYAAKG